jgi:hypothetical protein
VKRRSVIVDLVVKRRNVNVNVEIYLTAATPASRKRRRTPSEGTMPHARRSSDAPRSARVNAPWRGRPSSDAVAKVPKARRAVAGVGWINAGSGGRLA